MFYYSPFFNSMVIAKFKYNHDQYSRLQFAALYLNLSLLCEAGAMCRIVGMFYRS